MYNITLICTEHAERGKCSIGALYKIIVAISPDIIFLEVPPAEFNAFYTEKSRSNLESIAIHKYSETHRVVLVPVDSDNIPVDFVNNYILFSGKVEANSFEYRNLVDRHIQYVGDYGFKYLNSIYCDDICGQIYCAIDKSLEDIGDDKLFHAYNLWNEINEKREHEMLNNICSYSKNNRFDTGLFLVGAAHRRSIINKINDNAGSEDFQLNWNYDNYDSIL